MNGQDLNVERNSGMFLMIESRAPSSPIAHALTRCMGWESLDPRTKNVAKRKVSGERLSALDLPAKRDGWREKPNQKEELEAGFSRGEDVTILLRLILGPCRTFV